MISFKVCYTSIGQIKNIIDYQGSENCVMISEYKVRQNDAEITEYSAVIFYEVMSSLFHLNNNNNNLDNNNLDTDIFQEKCFHCLQKCPITGYGRIFCGIF